MDSLDQRLSDHLTPPVDPRPAMEAFDRRLRRTRRITWAALGVSIGMIGVGAHLIAQADQTRAIVAGAVIALFGGQIQVLVKLWYWQVHTRIQLQRDLRLLLADPE